MSFRSNLIPVESRRVRQRGRSAEPRQACQNFARRPVFTGTTGDLPPNLELAVLALTRHAQQRSQQRAVRMGALEACLAWGTAMPQPRGRTAFHLGRREVALAARLGCNIDAFRDTALVLASDGTVITVIRTSDRSRLRRCAA